MLNWILAILFSVIFFFILIKVFIYFNKKRTPTYKIDGDGYNNYFHHFNQVVKPDIRLNKDIMDEVLVKSETGDGFTVSSKLNDKKLKELLMEQYQLTSKEIQVTQGNFFV